MYIFFVAKMTGLLSEIYIVKRSARQSSQTRKELRLVGVMILATWSPKDKDTYSERLSGIN